MDKDERKIYSLNILSFTTLHRFLILLRNTFWPHVAVSCFPIVELQETKNGTNTCECVMNYRIRSQKKYIDSPIIKMAEHSISFSFWESFSFNLFLWLQLYAYGSSSCSQCKRQLLCPFQ